MQRDKKGSQQIIPADDSNLKKSQNIKVAVTKKISLKKLKKKLKQIKFSASSGKITVKKGTKKGIYKIKVQMTVPGNAAYKEFAAIKTIKALHLFSFLVPSEAEGDLAGIDFT